MLLLGQSFVFVGTASSSSNSRSADDLLQRLYALTLWLGETHTPMVAFLASFLAPGSLRDNSRWPQRVRIKEDEATLRSSTAYTRQLKPLFGLLRTVEDLKNRHQLRPVPSESGPAIASSSRGDGLTDIDREVLATLCNSWYPEYNPSSGRRSQYHAREVQMQIVLVLYLLRYMTKHPPPSGVEPFLPAPAPIARPFPMHGGRSKSAPSAILPPPAKQDIFSLNKRFEALVEQLSVLQLRAVVPELHSSQDVEATSKVLPLYARPTSSSVSAAEDTPSKHQLYVTSAAYPDLFTLQNLMATFYTPILEPLFATALPQQLALFRDRCGDLDIGDTVWASDPESSPVVPARSTMPPPAVPSTSASSQAAAAAKAADETPPPAPSKSSNAAGKAGKKSRIIPLGTPDLAPEKKARKHPPLFTKMLGGGREISMDSRTFTRSASAGPTAMLLGEGAARSESPGVAAQSSTAVPLMLTTTTMLMPANGETSGPSAGHPDAGGSSQILSQSTTQISSQQRPIGLPASLDVQQQQQREAAAAPVAPVVVVRENPFKVGPFSSAAKRKFPFSSAAGAFKRVHSAEPGGIKKEE